MVLTSTCMHWYQSSCWPSASAHALTTGGTQHAVPENRQRTTWIIRATSTKHSMRQQHFSRMRTRAAHRNQHNMLLPAPHSPSPTTASSAGICFRTAGATRIAIFSPLFCWSLLVWRFKSMARASDLMAVGGVGHCLIWHVLLSTIPCTTVFSLTAAHIHLSVRRSVQQRPLKVRSRGAQM